MEEQSESTSDEEKKLGELFDGLWNLGTKWQEAFKPVNELLQAKDENRGRLLQYHLVLEHVIEKVLKNTLPELSLKKARLSFSQKVALLPRRGRLYEEFIPGIREINKLRNGYAHKLNMKLTVEGAPIISAFIGLPKSKDMDEAQEAAWVIDAVEKYCFIVLVLLLRYTDELAEDVEAFIEKYPGVKSFFSQTGRGSDSR